MVPLAPPGPTVRLDEDGRAPICAGDLRVALSAWEEAARDARFGLLTFTGRAFPTPDGTVLALSDSMPGSPTGLPLSELTRRLDHLSAEGVLTVALLSLMPGDLGADPDVRLLGASLDGRSWRWTPVVLDLSKPKGVFKALEVNPDLPGKYPRRFALEDASSKRVGWLVVTQTGFKDPREEREVCPGDRFPDGDHVDHWLFDGAPWPVKLTLRELGAATKGKELDGISYKHKQLAHDAKTFDSASKKRLSPSATHVYVAEQVRIVLEVDAETTRWHAAPALVDGSGYLIESEVFPLTLEKKELPAHLKEEQEWRYTR